MVKVFTLNVMEEGGLLWRSVVLMFFIRILTDFVSLLLHLALQVYDKLYLKCKVNDAN